MTYLEIQKLWLEQYMAETRALHSRAMAVNLARQGICTRCGIRGVHERPRGMLARMFCATTFYDCAGCGAAYQYTVDEGI